MLRILKSRWFGAGLGLFAAAASASAFAIWGPKEGYQADNLGYNRLVQVVYPEDFPDGGWFIQTPEALYAPHNIGEEYRWSVPVLYYTYDPSFWEYFGSNGVAAVDSAFDVLNALTNMSTYSADLSEFPLDVMRVNYTARALHLLDLKSAALEMLVGRMGLADPERFTWTIRTRTDIPGASCPIYDYTIIQRNFDPVTTEPTKYVNGAFYTYLIRQFCPPLDRVDAEEFAVDPLAFYQSAVASAKITHPNEAYYGYFHTGLTRDDVGGLRYLYRASNRNVEAAPPESLLFATNYNVNQLLFTSNLTLLVNQALTNDAGALQALYPGLVIDSTTAFFTNVVTTNVFFYFTNLPWNPVGSVTLASQTILTTNVVTLFSHAFGNVVTNTYATSGWVTVLTTNISVEGCGPWGAGEVCTNITLTPVFTNFIQGDYFILPPNSECGFSLVSTQLTFVTTFTNETVIATNLPGVVNTNGTEFSQTLIFTSTNRAFVINPVPCVTNSVALRGGLEKISFVRRDFDSLLNRFFYPITNIYTMTAVTNNQPFLQRFARVVLRPDILIEATDITVGPGVDPVSHLAPSVPSLNNTNAISGLAGPGTLEGPITLTFNRVGPIRLNYSPSFVAEQNSIFYFNWGSFDGSTNPPVVYPSGRSIADLEAQILIQVSPPDLPPAARGVAYSTTLSVTGGQPPYVWERSPGSLPLPPGISLTANPTNSAQAFLTGTPTVAGGSNVVIRLTDAGARFVDVPYVFVVNP